MLLSVEDNSQLLGPYLHKKLWIRVVVALVCLLSVFGSVLIILSFICFKQLRSRGRQILVHISIMDLGVGLANLTGCLVYFDQYYKKTLRSNCTFPPFSVLPAFPQGNIPSHIWCPQSLLVRDLCMFQASLALYCTLGSIFCSNYLSVYLYFRIVHVGNKLVVHVFRFSCFVSYCVPLFVTIWLLLTGRLGFSPYESEGWCSIILKNPSTQERDLFASVFGYNIWIIITFIVIPLLSLAIHVHVKQLKTIAVYRSSDQLALNLRNIDYKFLLIPVVFIGLRFWSFLGDLLHVYIGVDRIPTAVATALILLQGIGDSGQGIVNVIIFVFFTKKVRKELVCPCKRSSRSVVTIQRADENDQTSLLDDSEVVDPDYNPMNYTDEDTYTDQGSSTSLHL